jgi:hypothetical protein
MGEALQRNRHRYRYRPGGGGESGYRDVFVTGYSYGGATGYDYAMVGYSASGTQLWAERYARSGSGNDFATSVAVNASGSAVYVTGRKRSSKHPV